MTQRWMVLLGLLGLSAWLALSRPAPPVLQDVVEVTPRERQPAKRAAPTPPAREDMAAAANGAFVAALTHRDMPAAAAATQAQPMLADPFASRDWSPAANAPKTAEPLLPTPPAAAPPLPFNYLGKQRIDDVWEVFLAMGEQTLIVREGQTIDGDNYRVESIKPPTLVLIYTPLAQQQTIGIGGEE
jgi:hypothetical protein